jgi:type IV pilus biogenesis protein CpaD/CtpE
MRAHLRLTPAIGLRALLAPLALLSGLAGCASTDPLLNPNDWHPSGVNEANIAAQVANPQDLIHGRAATGSDGEIASTAVLRLRAGKVKALPDSSLSDLKIGTSPTAGGTP